MKRVSGAAARHLAFASAHLNDCCVAGFVDVDAIRPGAKNRKRQIGSVDLKRFVVIEAFHANPQSARGELDLRGVVIEI